MIIEYGMKFGTAQECPEVFLEFLRRWLPTLPARQPIAPGLLARTHDNLLAFLSPTEFYTLLNSAGALPESARYRIGPASTLNNLPKGTGSLDARVTQLLDSFFAKMDSLMIANKAVVIAPVYQKVLNQMNMLLPEMQRVYNSVTVNFINVRDQIQSLTDRLAEQAAEIVYYRSQVTALSKEIIKLRKR